MNDFSIRPKKSKNLDVIIFELEERTGLGQTKTPVRSQVPTKKQLE